MNTVEASHAPRLRKTWIAIRRLSAYIDRALMRLGQWLSRVVLRAVRAFLAGAGAFSLMALIVAFSAGFDSLGTRAMLSFVITGGVLGVAIQRFFKKFAWLRKIAQPIGVEAISDLG